MFIPVEPAYLLALQHDAALFQECFDKRIMPVGPSTLLATLRTVAHIWRNEQQNQNALAIAAEGGRLYDKFTGFVQTLESVGKNIDQAQSQFQQAYKQLSQGRGNLVSRAEKLRALGVKNHQTPATRFSGNRPRVCFAGRGRRLKTCSSSGFRRRGFKTKRAHDASFLSFQSVFASNPRSGCRRKEQGIAAAKRSSENQRVKQSIPDPPFSDDLSCCRGFISLCLSTRRSLPRPFAPTG